MNSLLWIPIVLAGLALATWVAVRLWHYRMSFNAHGITLTISPNDTYATLETKYNEHPSKPHFDFLAFLKTDDKYGNVGIRLLAETCLSHPAITQHLLTL